MLIGLVCQLNITSVTLKWEAVDFESDDELVYELQCSYPGSESNFRQVRQSVLLFILTDDSSRILHHYRSTEERVHTT
jgi:hypothetical protein